ncbi:phosphatidylethanolamine-binding protein homolog F40A3.3-like [Planococcus citri]|uniref:phosphatidylethanolamine-binding protein homolog F40A3.3-like n=1 Tax=Planococcus citri TaxID=170843 RepID=UPI0031F868E1
MKQFLGFYVFVFLFEPFYSELIRDHNVITDEVWEAYHKAHVCPDVMPWPPPWLCTIHFPNNLTLDRLGMRVNASQVQQKPRLKYNSTNRLSCMYMAALRLIPTQEDFRFTGAMSTHVTRYFVQRMEWPQWIVGNIPNGDVEKGDTIWDYQPVLVPHNYQQKQVYVIFIFYQKARINFHKLIGDQKYEEIHKFATWYLLDWPEFGNFFKIFVERDEGDDISASLW